MSPLSSPNCSTDMEKKLILFTLLLLLPLAAMSQDRLRSSAVFDGKVVPKDRMVETIVKGDYLKDYGLSMFRSVRMDSSLSFFLTAYSNSTVSRY